MNILKKHEFAYDFINQAIRIDANDSKCYILKG